jgi:hypothetical protein
MAMLMMVDLSPNAWWTFSALFPAVSLHQHARKRSPL